MRAVAYGAYKLYKYVTRPRSWLTQFRMVQYGFKPRDNDELLSKIITLENLLLKSVKVSDKAPATIGSDVPWDKVRGIFGVDANDEAHMKEFLAWLQYRFKPIFLSHCTILYQFTKKLDLQAIDDNLDTAQKLDYLLKVHFPNDDKSPYHVGASPFKNEKIQESAADVAEAYGDYRKLIQKDKDEQDSKIKEKKRQDALTPDQRKKEDAAKKAEEQKSWYNKSKAGAAKLAKAGMDKLTDAKDWVKNLYDKAVDKTSDAMSSVADLGGKAWDYTKTKAGQAYQAIKAVVGKPKEIMAMALQELPKAGIVAKEEVAMFLAQLWHESGGFKSLSENLNYSADTLMRISGAAKKAGRAAVEAAVSQGPAAIAELMYGGRMGNAQPGDAFKYRGRGLIQLTGKDNYAAASKEMGVDLVNNPDMASDPMVALKIAMWYWKKRVGSVGATGDVAAVTKRINGGTIGLADRANVYKDFLQRAATGTLGALVGLPAAAGAAVGAGAKAVGAGLVAGATAVGNALTTTTPAAAAPTGSAPAPVTTDPKTVANQNAATASTVAAASTGSNSLGTTTNMEATNGILSKQLGVQTAMRDLLSEIRDLTKAMNAGESDANKASAGQGGASPKPAKPAPKAPVHMGTQ